MASPDCISAVYLPKAYEFLEASRAPFFKEADEGVQKRRHDAQKDDAHQEPIHFKHLA